MKRRLVELGKDILIVLLISSLLLLSMMAIPVETIRGSERLSRMLQPLAPLLGLSQAELAYVETTQPVLDAAQPVVISVNSPAGRTTAMWDFAALDGAYDTFGGQLGQALDTAQLLTKVGDTQVRQALTAPGVYFRYGTSLPASLLASWLGAVLQTESVDADAFLLAVEDGAVVLYFLGEHAYRSQTQLEAAALEALMEPYRPDGSRFAFEADYDLAYDVLLPGGSVELPAAVASSPCDSRYIDELATALGFNPYDETRYTDDDGVTFLSEPNCALEIAASGHVVLTSSAQERFRAASAELAAQVEQARQLVELVNGVSGAGRVYLSGVMASEEQTVCSFSYLFSGIPVSGAQQAATVTFSGRDMVRLEAQVYSFALTGETLYPLPVAQAAAVRPAGADLQLQYRIDSSRSLLLGWVK